MAKNIDIFIEETLNTLTPKQRRVLKERYGLNGKRKTLQEIGDTLSVTRERIRQIENQSLKKISGTVNENFGTLISAAEKHLKNLGGVREDKVFMEELAELSEINTSGKNWREKTRLLLLAASKPLFFRENINFKSYWHSDESANTKFINFVDKTVKSFEAGDKVKVLEDQNFANKVKNTSEYGTLLISKKFGVNSFGDIGLVKWAEIKPKNVRDKAYLTLKKTDAPLHFRDIAKQIHKTGVSQKPVNIQTVHNELIKDERFVLVGRGMYALREKGYESGTVKDLIATYLKNNGPLTSEKVVNFVNQQRLLKENTILLNLQNRKYFKRLDDGKYTVREA